MVYFWLVLVIFLGFIEAGTVSLVSIWFIISGIIAMFMSLVIDSFIIQFTEFVVVGLLLMLTTRKFLTQKLIRKEKTNLDRIIGTVGIVTEDIPKNEVGEVKVDGKKWSAVSDEVLKKGTKVKILKIKGVKLEVKSWEE